MKLLLSGQMLVHEDTNGNGKRLCAHITGHIQNHRLESHDQGELLDDCLEKTDDRRYADPHKHEKHQPGKTFSDAELHRLLQILLRGQTTELCVILTHLVIDNLYYILRGDDTQDAVVVRQNRYGLLGIVLDLFQTVFYFFVGIHIRICRSSDILQTRSVPRDDQILQINGSVVHTVVIQHIDHGDVVVFRRLLDQRAHRLLDGKTAVQCDKIGGHTARNRVFIVRSQHLNRLSRLRIHQLQPGSFLL